MSASLSAFTDQAAREIDAMHRLLQAWFRAEGSDDPAPLLARFDEGFNMVSPAGKLVSYQQFSTGLPGMRGLCHRNRSMPGSRAVQCSCPPVQVMSYPGVPDL